MICADNLQVMTKNNPEEQKANEAADVKQQEGVLGCGEDENPSHENNKEINREIDKENDREIEKMIGYENIEGMGEAVGLSEQESAFSKVDIEKIRALPESELKRLLDEMRHDISRKKRKLRELYDEQNTYTADARELRSKRDKFNKMVEEKFNEANLMRDKRDMINQDAAVMREKRREYIDVVKPLGEKIKEMKEERDRHNKIARGTNDIIGNLYNDALERLINRDIPLDYEKDLFDKVLDFKKRYNAIKWANKIHENISTVYDEIRKWDDPIDEISAKIDSLSKEAQQYHEQAVAVYKEIDDLKKESDDYHKRLIDTYEAGAPLRMKIMTYKKQISELQQDITPYTERLHEIKAEKELKSLEKRRNGVRDKLVKKKRVDLHELQLIMDAGESIT